MYYYTTDYCHLSLRLCAEKGEITVNPKLNKDYRGRNISMLPQKGAMVKDMAKTNQAGEFTRRIGHERKTTNDQTDLRIYARPGR